MSTIKLIGLGNPFLGDDAVGVLIARHLQSCNLNSVFIMDGGLVGLKLLHEMEGTNTLILIDAVHSQSEVGTVFRFTVPHDLQEIANFAWSTSSSSTHDFGLAEALTLAHTLKMLPSQTIVYGIEIGHIQKGQALSSKVKESTQKLIHRIVDEELSIPHA